MAAIEIVSYLLFCCYLLSFFGLTWAAAKQAGKPVWLFNKRSEKQALPAMLFRLSFAGAAIWPLLRALGLPAFASDPMVAALDGRWVDILGLFLVAIGALAAVVSQRHMGASWRIGAAEGETGAIVDDGPFAISRNPVFVGQMLMFAGLFLAFPSIVQVVLTAALFGAVHMQVRIEERVLAATLGQPYVDYTQHVSRWIGVRTA